MKKLFLLSLVIFMTFLSCNEENVLTNVDYSIDFIDAEARDVEVDGSFSADSDVHKITVIYSDDYEMNEFNNVTAQISENRFNFRIYDLKPNTRYYYYLKFVGENNFITTDINEFTTIDEIIIERPTVTTKSVSGITHNSAICGGDVKNDGGANVYVRGVCYSTSQNPTVDGSHTLNGEGTGEFTSTITGLSPNTKYYIRAYATNSAGTSYGEEKSFTTTQNGNPINAWLKYDSGVDDAIGYSSGPGSFYWGVRFPASTMQEYAGTSLTKVYYESHNETHTGDILIYLGGEHSPETLVHTQPYNADKVDTAFEFELTKPIEIDASKSLWIAMKNNTGQYIASVTETNANVPDGRWNSDDGENWYDLAEDGLEDIIWVIRGFVTDEVKGEVIIEPVDYEHKPTSNPSKKSLEN